jgi:FtsP/CotA-like multicopper oxidase with cupredoxin domain
MRLKNASVKLKTKAEKAIHARMGFFGLLLAGGMLFVLLILGNGTVDTDNASSSDELSMSEILALSGNENATPGTQEYYRERLIAKFRETSEREAAAERFKALSQEAKNIKAASGAALTVAPPLFDPGGIPHYFGPYPNYANSPLPNGTIMGINVTNGGSGYTTPTVTIQDVYGTGTGATVGIVTVVGGVITNIPLTSGGTGYTAPVVTITDPSVTATGATATASIAGSPLTGGIRKFMDSLPGLNVAGANDLGQYIPVAIPDKTTFPGSDYYVIELGEYSEKLHPDLPATRLRGYRQTNTADTTVSQFHYLGPLVITQRDRPVRVKFVNNLSTGAGGDLFIPVDTTVMGSGMGPNMIMPMTAVMTGTGTNARITTSGNHGLAVGQLVMLHEFTPAAYNGEFRVIAVNSPTQFEVTLKYNPGIAASSVGMIMELYTQNRGTSHMHGAFVPWISDGTPHQWTTPATENTSYPKGVSVQNVPDMPPAGPGEMTFYYNNNQSARLMFYHDHSYGITRLNVYAGEAAPYVITDPVEQDLINGTNFSGVNPGLVTALPGYGIPLVIQDRSFVDNNTINVQDPTWNWGTGPRDAVGNMTKSMTGDLWYPHVYMPNQNPSDLSGMNAFGRWHYGPWFWPPTSTVSFPPIPNPYFGTAPWENRLMPATPNPSMAMEAFMDTPLVNGAAYPNLTVEPKAYRFRILDAADDRFINLQLYKATPIISRINVTNGGSGYTSPTVTITDQTPGTGRGATAAAAVVNGAITEITLLTVGSNYTNPLVTITDPTGTLATAMATVYTNLTEVGMVPAVKTPGFPEGWPTDGREGGVPDPATRGPSFIQIGTEGGFLPAPVELPNQPVGWNFDQTNFDFGNVNQGTLILGTAERADVLVNFTEYAGQTLILYNDAPAPFPAIDARYDYYTGHPDMTDTGGAPTTLPGYGPNTRTIMQIKVLPAVTTQFNVSLPVLEGIFANSTGKSGIFNSTQDQILVPQSAYDTAYNKIFPADQFLRIFNFTHTFQTVDGGIATLPLEPKAIQDEMGETYDTKYGRMSAMLGLTLTDAAPGGRGFVMFPYPAPPVEIVNDSLLATPIGSLGDGTQIWKITHNGVDTHTVHVHLFNAQMINRVAWDNAVRVPDANELGWKETFRVNPLQDTFIALRPTAPIVPFKINNSTRPIDPTIPLGEPLEAPPGGFKDPEGNPVTILNHLVNFGWEYVWHCHLLAHEEMDMMHGMSFVVAPEAPTNLVVTLSGAVPPVATLNWVDNSISETGFTIQRATDASFTTGLTTFTVGPNVATYIDTTVSSGTIYYYRVRAINVVGDTTVYPAPAVGFPQKTAYSDWSNTAIVPEVLTISAIGTDNSLQIKQLNGAAWGAWENLGGYARDLDSTSSAGNVYVFARGGDNALWYRNWNGVAWSDWQTLGGWMDLLDSTSSGGSVYAFARGGDNILWYRNWNGVTWAEWQSLGGFVTDLDSTSSAGNVYAFARGGDNALWYRNWNGVAWSDWQSLGGFVTDLDSTSSGDSVNVFARGGDDALWYRNWNGVVWSDWQSLGGSITRLDATLLN